MESRIIRITDETVSWAKKAVDEEQYTVVTPSVKMKALENADQFVTAYLSKNYNIIINQLYDQK